MSSKDDLLERIAKSLDKVVKSQKEIASRLDRLERRTETSATPEASSSGKVLGFLDFFRAGESLGEATTGAWIDVCRSEALRGSLRVIQMREGSHARLLEQRIKELGGSSKAEIPPDRFDDAMERSGSSSTSDAEKLVAFLKPFPDIDAAIAPILEMADKLDADPETQFLLRTIAQDERATLECLSQHCEALSS